MKANAMVRIILYTLTIVLLIFILSVGLGLRSTSINLGYGSGTTLEGETSFDPSKIQTIEIDWAAGSVEIRAADTDCITVTEVLPDGYEHRMTYKISGDTLELNYAKGAVCIGFGNWEAPSKDLIITVPIHWVCEELQIDGAALKIDLDGISVGSLELDGASCELAFVGSVDSVDIDGASADIHLTCYNRISAIDLDGASCSLEVLLPKDCGFKLEMDGLSCKLHTDLPGINGNGQTLYGDGHCQIVVDGLSCDVTVQENQVNAIE